MKTLKRGFSLIEMAISVALVSILLSLLAYALRNSQKLWSQTSGSSDVQQQLRRAEVSLRRDLQLASTSWATSRVGPQQGPGFSGDAFWFLTPEIDASGEVARKFNGSPLYQRNVLYYLTVPHDDSCAGALGPDNYDDRCPHKTLIRKLIDSGAPSTPGDENHEEQLMSATQINAYLTRPNGVQVSHMKSESNVKLVSLVARQLLWFRVNASPPPLQFELRATNLVRGSRELRSGSSLYNSPLTSELRLTLAPSNP